MTRVGRLLNPGRSTGHLAQLAACTGASLKTVRNWTVPEDDAQYRAMPRTAKRLVAVLAYFGLMGQLSSERMDDIVALEAAMEEDERFEDLAQRLRRLLAENDDEEDA